MNDVAPPSLVRRLHDFHCWKCGGKKAYQSRPRGFFEKRLLPLLLMKPVRCETCFHRAYVLRMVWAIERPAVAGKIQGQGSGVSSPDQRIA